MEVKSITTHGGNAGFLVGFGDRSNPTVKGYFTVQNLSVPTGAVKLASVNEALIDDELFDVLKLMVKIEKEGLAIHEIDG